MTKPSRMLPWVQKFNRTWQPPRKGAEIKALREGIKILQKTPIAGNRGITLPGQPFDQHLLSISKLYKKSRQLFVKHGGSFEGALLSPARSLSSPTLLESKIEYNPAEAELLWLATDPLEQKSPQRLQALRPFMTNIFHEQNHRLLWGFLPPAPRAAEPLRRYMNFAEALVVTLDMALADEIGPSLSRFFQIAGVTYDPGTELSEKTIGKALYRKYLQATLYGTYLTLQFCDAAAVNQILHLLFADLEELTPRAARRSSNLNPNFVNKTNPHWQERHGNLVAKVKGVTGSEALVLPDDALDCRFHQYIGEAWFQLMGV